jgi:hypothetical protein
MAGVMTRARDMHLLWGSSNNARAEAVDCCTDNVVDNSRLE